MKHIILIAVTMGLAWLSAGCQVTCIDQYCSAAEWATTECGLDGDGAYILFADFDLPHGDTMAECRDAAGEWESGYSPCDDGDDDCWTCLDDPGVDEMIEAWRDDDCSRGLSVIGVVE